MATKRDYYEVLGVSKTATQDEIKSAYRKKAKECHPDLHPNDKTAEERFKELNEANEVLSNPEKRAQYDQYGFDGPNMGGNPFGGAGGGFDFGGMGGFDSIFDQLFNGGMGGSASARRNAPVQGNDLRYELRITFDTNLRWRDTELDLRLGDHGAPITDPDMILMEIKFPGVCPLWLSRLLSREKVFPTSFSKYGACYRNHILPNIQKEGRTCA